MRFKVALQITGLINIILSITMLVPLIVSLVYQDGYAMTFVTSSAVAASTGAILFVVFRTKGVVLSHREGFLVAAWSWIFACLFGSLPFYFSGHFASFTDIIFESTSGLTTTGASVLTNVEILPKSILFWRSFTHWIGGIGIVLFGVAILPILGIGGMQLYKAEASTVSGDKMVSRTKDMARIILVVYSFLTFLCLVFLVMSGMGIFDSLIHTFGALGTGGFSNKNSSISYYSNFPIELILIVFMLLGGTNFSMHYEFYRTGLKSYYKNEEFRFYLIIVAIATVFLAINLYISHHDSVLYSARTALFQASSIITTTGYASADFNQWPDFSRYVLLFLMFIGGCAGSTAGSIKCVRILLLFKVIGSEVNRLVHPHAVTAVKLNGKVIPADVIKSVGAFVVLFFAAYAISALILAATGLNFLTAISSAAAAIGNIGPGLDAAGPMSNYSGFSTIAKWVLITDMILGRLEIYTLIILFLPVFWRK